MLSKLLSHVRHNVVAYIALFIAMGGSAYAAKPLLTGADVQDGTLNSADLRDRGSTSYPGPSVQGTDLEANTLTGAEIDESTLGKVGDANTLDTKDSTDFGSGAFTGRVNGSVDAGQTRYAGTSGVVGLGTLAVRENSQLSPNSTIVARDLAVRADTIIPGGATATFTLVDNGTDTAVSCSLTGFGLNNSCNSGTASASIGPGHELSLKIEVVGGEGDVEVVRFGWRATTP